MSTTTPFRKKMGTTKIIQSSNDPSKDDDRMDPQLQSQTQDSSLPTTNDTTTTVNSNASKSNDDSFSSLFEPEIVQPEWLELPKELQHIDFQKEEEGGASDATTVVAWDKYQPYSDRPPILTPLGTKPIFVNQVGHHQRALCFHLHAIDGRARAGTIHFNNMGGPPVPTPRFMPVGTKATLKSVLPQEIPTMNCPMILANTYHLALQPGTSLIDSIFGGLPKFMGGETDDDDDDETSTTNDSQEDDRSVPSSPKRKRRRRRRRLFNLLTDSGGFQMVSLAALSNVTEEGVVFESPYEKGKVTKLRPEDSIQCQNEIGADVIMQLDDVISSVQSDDGRFRLATLRTLRWYDRCVQAHSKPHEQNLYPILQGHLDITKGGLRDICLAGFQYRDTKGQSPLFQNQSIPSSDPPSSSSLSVERTIPGFAVGGLAGGEAKEDFWKVVDHACRHLPDDRPRYLMGVGYPLDLVVCTALGFDQYDCVYPTRTARFGVALVDKGGILKLKQHEFATQHDQVLMEGCPCQACSRGISRARIHALLKSQNVLAIQLLTQHNICYMMGLVTRMREAILKSQFPEFVNEFLKAHFELGDDHSNGGDKKTTEKGDVFGPKESQRTAEIPQWVRDALQAAGITLKV